MPLTSKTVKESELEALHMFSTGDFDRNESAALKGFALAASKLAMRLSFRETNANIAKAKAGTSPHQLTLDQALPAAATG
jgi:hypothetical protein